MSNRYTAKDLQELVDSVNETMRKNNINWRFVVGGSYGYTNVYNATSEDVTRHCTHSLIEAGAPRVCADAVHRYAYYYLADKLREMRSGE